MSIGGDIMEEHYKNTVISKYKNLINLQREYIRFLSEEITKYAFVSQYVAPKEVIKQGEIFREKLAQLNIK